jgi:hypothetical protein
MGRNIIINTQPGDSTVDSAVTRLQRKPTTDKWKARLAFPIDRLSELELAAEDKVYLVGHGGDSGTLGGRAPIELALMVRNQVLPVGQINLVMCGNYRVKESAGVFTKTLQEGEDGYQGKVFAYAAPLEINSAGNKWADTFEGPELAKVMKFDATERLQVAAEPDKD